MTFVDTSNTFYDMILKVNTASKGIVSYMLIIGLFLFVFTKTLDRGTTEAFIAASFAISIVAALMMFIELTTWPVVVMCVLLLLVSVIKKAFE
jgi:hypothetical protein